MKEIKHINVIPRPNHACIRKGMFRIPREKSESAYVVKVIDQSIADPEAYKLKVMPDKILVQAGTPRGLFYGEQSVRQLLATNIGNIPCMCICDAPMLTYRGFMIDSARHFQSLDDLKRMIEAAALFKFNKFHWHLTDDQGWRIQIDKYPRLTEIGSVRANSRFGKLKEEGPYGGFYTKEEIREIVQFCADRYIDVIPEINMPGHATAALAAYPEYSCRGEQIAVQELPGVHPNVFCAGKEETYTFLTDILDEVIELFPYEKIHIGGDEAPKVRWEKCPACQAKIQENGLRDEEALQGYLINRVVRHLHRRGRTVITWNESLHSGNLDSSVTVQMWMDKKLDSVRWANLGNNVILSELPHCYMDYSYGQTPLMKAYAYKPVPKGVDEFGMRSIWGVEALIWTEYVNNMDRMSYQCFPRFAAIAEVGWTKPAFRNERDLQNRFLLITPMLQALGIEPAPQEVWNQSLAARAIDKMKFRKQAMNKDIVKQLRTPMKKR